MAGASDTVRVQAVLSSDDELGNEVAGWPEGWLAGWLLVNCEGELVADLDAEQAIETAMTTSGATCLKRKTPARSLARTGDFSTLTLIPP